jgi:hypothetical protein
MYNNVRSGQHRDDVWWNEMYLRNFVFIVLEREPRKFVHCWSSVPLGDDRSIRLWPVTPTDFYSADFSLSVRLVL